MRSVYVCPDCDKYVEDYPTDSEFHLCGTCYQTWETAELNLIEVPDA